MKFLIRSGCGESLPIALRLKEEGNMVKFAISEEANEYQEIGEGLVDKAEFDGKAVGWADVVVFDSNVFELPYEAETLRNKGVPILGSSRLSGQLENDRSFAIQMAKKAGIRVPDIREFAGNDAWDQAKHYVSGFAGEDRKLVWKPNGEAPASTFVAESIYEMIEMFPYWDKLFTEHRHEPSFIITDAIEGEEISTEGWFDGEQFYLPNHTLERTRFFDGDHGEKTGCAGNVVWQGDTPLYHKLFDKLKPVFGGRYAGPVDINVIIEKDSNDPVFLEFTPRFGYDAIFGLMEILNSDLGDLFYQIAYGQEVKFNVARDFAGAVRVHIPPYPEPTAEDDESRPVGLPIFNLSVKGQGRNSYYPIEVALKDDKFTTTGPDGYVIVVGGKGASPEQAMERAYSNVEEIRIPTARWRMDLGTKLQEVFGAIKGSGWINPSKANGAKVTSLFKRSA